ncbi:MAG: hypothetical protein K5648_01395 [Erysipelotrichaceae bacterium]|nr:hypothetical protein [Erysipelotrichaceae bacterium]
MEQLDRFTEELHEWSLNGKEPSLASRDLRYFLDLQEQRLKKGEIAREENFTHVKEEISGTSYRKENGYSSKILYREAMQEILFHKDGKQIKKIRRPVNLYVTFVDKEGHEDREYTCPNCGNKMSALQARDGCPYCGTFFETDDIYPCVSSYYTVPGVVERAGLMDRIKKELIIAASVSGVLIAALTFYAWNDMDLIFRIPASLFMGALYGGVLAFVWYMLRSFLLLFKLFKEAGRAVPLLKTLNSRKKMLEFMKRYDPDFSYEAFEGRVLSLLRMIAFSDERDSLSVYEGEDDLSNLDEIVDMQYRGALHIKKYEQDGTLLRVKGTAYLTDTYVHRAVQERDEKIDFVLEKKSDAHADPGFSIHRVSCPSCGGSFDAVHRKDCPYCGNAYDLKKKDWIVKKIDLR